MGKRSGVLSPLAWSKQLKFVCFCCHPFHGTPSNDRCVTFPYVVTPFRPRKESLGTLFSKYDLLCEPQRLFWTSLNMAVSPQTAALSPHSF